MMMTKVIKSMMSTHRQARAWITDDSDCLQKVFAHLWICDRTQLQHQLSFVLLLNMKNLQTIGKFQNFVWQDI